MVRLTAIYCYSVCEEGRGRVSLVDTVATGSFQAFQV